VRISPENINGEQLAVLYMTLLRSAATTGFDESPAVANNFVLPSKLPVTYLSRLEGFSLTIDEREKNKK
jgi:hypothetical protein